MTTNPPKLSDFLQVLKESIGGPFETKTNFGNWDNKTVFGRDREDHYPSMVHLDNGNVFNLYDGTDWCAISAGASYAEAAGWPPEWPLPAEMFYTPKDVASYKAANRWSDGPYSGKVGYFCFFDWKSDADRLANHVGTVIDVIKNAEGYITGYWINEGNVGSPSVYRRESYYSVNTDILGFGVNYFTPETSIDTGDKMIKYVCIEGHDRAGDPVLSTDGIMITWEANGKAFLDQSKLGFTVHVDYLDPTLVWINSEITRVSLDYVASRINGQATIEALRKSGINL